MLSFQVESVDLPSPWSGIALIAAPDDEPTTGRLTAYPTKEEWSRVLQRLLSDASSLPGYAVLKYSGSGEVFRARLEGSGRTIDIICKRNRRVGLHRRLAVGLGLGPMRREFDRCLALRHAGIDTAIPLALIRRSSRPAEEWLIHEFVTDGVDLDHLLLGLLPRLDRRSGRAVKNAIIGRLVDVFVRMREHGLYHRDLKASNIMLRRWQENAEGIDICLVDLEGLKRSKWLQAARRWKPVVRLAASVLDYRAVTRSDYCRFLQAYLLATGQARSAWKTQFPLLAGKASRYVHRSLRRKREQIDGYELGPIPKPP